MATFQILGRGKTSGRKRRRTLGVIDRATVLELMEDEGTLVEDCVEWQYPPASLELRTLLFGLAWPRPTTHLILNASVKCCAGVFCIVAALAFAT